MRRLVPAAAGVLACSCTATGGAADEKRPPPLSQHFVSRPDLQPPVVNVRTHARGATPGYVFIAPKLRVAQAGPMILDDAGRVVWFKPLDMRGVTDFRVQRYQRAAGADVGAKKGFETAIPLSGAAGDVAVRALAAGGEALGLSAVLKR